MGVCDVCTCQVCLHTCTWRTEVRVSYLTPSTGFAETRALSELGTSLNWLPNKRAPGIHPSAHPLPLVLDL